METEVLNQTGHAEHLATQMAKLCMSSVYADVVFVVEEVRIPAHRLILAVRSEYFRALLHGFYAESNQNEIKLHVRLEPFKSILRYLYSGFIPAIFDSNEILYEVLALAHEYGLEKMEQGLITHVDLTLDTVCAVLDTALLYKYEKLRETCLKYMDNRAEELVRHEKFYELSKAALEEVLKRDSFYASEVNIFFAVAKWYEHNADPDNKSVFNLIRLALISVDDLFDVVQAERHFNAEQIVDAIKLQKTRSRLPYRAAVRPNINVTSPEFNPAVIKGSNRGKLFNGSAIVHPDPLDHTHYHKSENPEDCIMIRLDRVYLVNHIQFFIWDGLEASYAYYVEYSADKTKWYRLFSFTQCSRIGWQEVVFPAIPLRYIRIVATACANLEVFAVVYLNLFYRDEFQHMVPQLKDADPRYYRYFADHFTLKLKRVTH